jgi:AcrR family transcriptional regulator
MNATAANSSTPARTDTDGARERLLDSATRLFAANGYEATSVRDIVAAANVNLNGVNYYFGGKRGLYDAVMAREVARARSLTEGLARAAASDPIELRLESVVLRLLTFFVSTHSQLPRLAALEIVNSSPDPAEPKPPIYEAEREELRAIVARVLGPRAKPRAIDQGVRSILSQCLYFMFMGDALQRAGSPVFANAGEVRKLAAYIATFSLGGLRACSNPPPDSGPTA